MQTMTPQHPQWETFCNRLAGPEGCNFHEKEPNNPKSVCWRCNGGDDKSYATAILKSMPGIDVAASLQYFDDNGGYCDCEILFNLAPEGW